MKQIDWERDPETFAIIGAAMEVHRTLGGGFLEAVYQEALAVELASRDIPHAREVERSIRYKEVTLGVRYRADFVCCRTIIVELKAARELTGTDQAQVINYLKASGLERALLINFGASSLQYKRLIWTKDPRQSTIAGVPSAARFHISRRNRSRSRRRRELRGYREICVICAICGFVSR